jgi:hypothetical protein
MLDRVRHNVIIMKPATQLAKKEEECIQEEALSDEAKWQINTPSL